MKGTRYICCRLVLLLCHISSLYTLAKLRSPHVGDGSAPSSWVCNVCMYDFVHKFHSHNILYGIWSFVTGLCHSLSCCRISCYDRGSNRANVFDGKVSTKLIHRLHNWGRCIVKCILDDTSIYCYIFGGKCPRTCRWNMRKKRLTRAHLTDY